MRILDTPLFRGLAFAPALAFLTAFPSGSYAEKTAVIVSSASVDGETISCGCTKKDLGGIARRATIIREVRGAHPGALVVDAGNFGSQTGYNPWMRTTFQWEMMKKMGYDVVTPGPAELIQGLPAAKDMFATAPDIQVVSANITDKEGNPVWPASTVIERNGIRYGVTGVTDRAYYAFNLARGNVQSEDFEFEEIPEALGRVLPELRKQSDVVVVLLHTGPADAQRMGDAFDGADVVVVGNHPGYKFVPERRGNTLMVRAGSRGQYVEVLELTLDDANEITDHSGEARSMGEAVAEDPQYKEIVDRFNKKYDDEKKASGYKDPVQISP